MKKNIVLPELLIIVLFMLASFAETTAQNKVYMFYMNEHMETVPKEQALIVGKGTRRDSVFLVQYYAAGNNQLLMVESYKDSTLKRILLAPCRSGMGLPADGLP